MAHKKGQGSSSNGRDSNAQRLGVKRFGGQFVKPSEIIVRQRGSKFKPGNHKLAFFGSDWTLHARVPGYVYFRGNRVYVWPAPSDTPNERKKFDEGRNGFHEKFFRFTIRAQSVSRPDAKSRAKYFAQRYRAAFGTLFERLNTIKDAKFLLVTCPTAPATRDVWEELIPSPQRDEWFSDLVIRVTPDLITPELLLDCNEALVKQVKAIVHQVPNVIVHQDVSPEYTLIPFRLEAKSSSSAGGNELQRCSEGESLYDYGTVCDQVIKRDGNTEEVQNRLKKRLLVFDSGLDLGLADELGGISVDEVSYWEWLPTVPDATRKVHNDPGKFREVSDRKHWIDSSIDENPHGTMMTVRAVGSNKNGIYPGAPVTIVRGFDWKSSEEPASLYIDENALQHWGAFNALIGEVVGGSFADVGVVNMSFSVSPDNDAIAQNDSFRDFVQSVTQRFADSMESSKNAEFEEKIWFVAAVQGAGDNFVNWPAASKHVIAVGVASDGTTTIHGAAGPPYETLAEFDVRRGQATDDNEQIKPDFLAIGKPEFDPRGEFSSYAAAAVSAKLLYLLHQGESVDRFLIDLRESTAVDRFKHPQYTQNVAVFSFPIRLLPPKD